MNDDNIKIAEWRNKVLELLQKLPEYNENDFGFEINAGHKCLLRREQYYFVEKGKYCNYFYDSRDVSKKTTKNLEQAICWVLENLIFDYAAKYEKSHRVRYEDIRRLLFKTEQDMYDVIGEPYSGIKRKEQAKILKQAPFDDARICRIDLIDDYGRIENWIKGSKYKDTLKYFSNMSRLLALWREKNGVKNFEKLFDKSRKEISYFSDILEEIEEDEDFTELIEILEYCEEVAEKYL